MGIQAGTGSGAAASLPRRRRHRPQAVGNYLASIPERAVRLAAAGAGGLVFEVSELIIPPVVRKSHVYQATVGRVLRIIVELVGGVRGRHAPQEMSAQELAVRKLAGNAIELASFVAVGWSPLWLLVAAADLVGGTRLYLQLFVQELKRTGVLPHDADVATVDDLLRLLDATTQHMADTIDIPPLNVEDMRRSLHMLRKHASTLPPPERLGSLLAQLQRAAQQNNRSLLVVSSLIAAGAVQAGIQMGHTYLFDYYRQALTTIQQEGLPAYVQRVSKPYVEAAARHLDPARRTHTQRLLQRLRRLLRRRPSPRPELAPEEVAPPPALDTRKAPTDGTRS